MSRGDPRRTQAAHEKNAGSRSSSAASTTTTGRHSPSLLIPRDANADFAKSSGSHPRDHKPQPRPSRHPRHPPHRPPTPRSPRQNVANQERPPIHQSLENSCPFCSGSDVQAGVGTRTREPTTNTVPARWLPQLIVLARPFFPRFRLCSGTVFHTFWEANFKPEMSRLKAQHLRGA
jgi:hypothetical protein